MTGAIKAIETRYAGHRFRSRLEARTAVFLDNLGVAWEYEPQSYAVNDDTCYLPDFCVRQPGMDELWLEVCPPGTGRSLQPFENFLGFDDAVGTITRRGFVVRDLPDPTRIDDAFSMPCVDGSPTTCQPGEALAVWDDSVPYLWCVCVDGVHVDLQYEARGHRINCPCTLQARAEGRIEGDWGHSGNHPRLIAAYAAGRAARFEHGERG